MRPGIAADHRGLELKNRLLSDLRAMCHQVVDFGAHEPDPDYDYPDFVVPLAIAVSKDEAERVVAICCGSGGRRRPADSPTRLRDTSIGGLPRYAGYIAKGCAIEMIFSYDRLVNNSKRSFGEMLSWASLRDVPRVARKASPELSVVRLGVRGMPSAKCCI